MQAQCGLLYDASHVSDRFLLAANMQSNRIPSIMKFSPHWLQELLINEVFYINDGFTGADSIELAICTRKELQ